MAGVLCLKSSGWVLLMWWEQKYCIVKCNFWCHNWQNLRMKVVGSDGKVCMLIWSEVRWMWVLCTMLDKHSAHWSPSLLYLTSPSSLLHVPAFHLFPAFHSFPSCTFPCFLFLEGPMVLALHNFGWCYLCWSCAWGVLLVLWPWVWCFSAFTVQCRFSMLKGSTPSTLRVCWHQHLLLLLFWLYFESFCYFYIVNQQKDYVFIW